MKRKFLDPFVAPLSTCVPHLAWRMSDDAGVALPTLCGWGFDRQGLFKGWILYECIPWAATDFTTWWFLFEKSLKFETLKHFGFYYFETPELHNRLMAEIRWPFWTETRNWSETAPWLMWLTNPPSRTKRTRERMVEKTADVGWPTFISNQDTNCKGKYQYFGNPSILIKWDSLIRGYIILFGSTIPCLIYDLILTHRPGEDEYVLLSHKNGDRHFCQPDSIGTWFLTLGEWQLCPCVSPGPNMDTAKVHASLMMGPVVSMAQNDSRIIVVTVADPTENRKSQK